MSRENGWTCCPGLRRNGQPAWSGGVESGLPEGATDRSRNARPQVPGMVLPEPGKQARRQVPSQGRNGMPSREARLPWGAPRGPPRDSRR